MIHVLKLLCIFGIFVSVLLPDHAWSASSVIRLGMVLEPPNLDPTVTAAGAVDEIVYANIFEGLTRLDETGTVRSALAKRWNVSPDGSVYVFYLREGVLFHDGSRFDAEDVKFSLNRARAATSTNGQKELFADIKSVEVMDPLTVRVTLLRTNGAFLYNMSLGDSVIVSPETALHNAVYPVGTGPFKFVEWIKGDHVTIVRNPDYWGQQVRLEKAVFRFISDPAAAYSAMMVGDLDVFPYFPAPELIPLLRADPRFSIVVGSTSGEVILSINNGRMPFNDKRVRQAIAHSIDRNAIIKGAMFGYGEVIGTHFAPHHAAYVDLTQLSAYDMEKGKKLLAEAGFADGFHTTLILPPPVYARRTGEIIAAQLRSVGIRVRIISMEWAQWLERVFKGKDFDLTIIAHTEPMDIKIYSRPSYYFQYDSEEFNEIMKQLNTILDPDARKILLQAAQTQIANDYVNGYLFQIAKISVANAKIKGLWVNAPLQANNLTGVYWED